MNVQHLTLEIPEWCLTPSKTLVREYEEMFGLTLPTDYRSFLVEFGGACVSASCPFLEPTPVGKAVGVEQFYGFSSPERDGEDVRWNTELIEGAPDVVAIAGTLMNDMLWLKCTGPDQGYVYYHDGDQRSLWPDELFRKRFPRLHPDIEEYLELRRQGKLPQKREGYESVYLVARSFTEFITALQNDEDEQ